MAVPSKMQPPSRSAPPPRSRIRNRPIPALEGRCQKIDREIENILDTRRYFQTERNGLKDQIYDDPNAQVALKAVLATIGRLDREKKKLERERSALCVELKRRQNKMESH